MIFLLYKKLSPRFGQIVPQRQNASSNLCILYLCVWHTFSDLNEIFTIV
jgi:hypothetical protein